MTRAERWAFRIWLFAAVGTLVATFLNWVVVLLILMVIPAPLAFLITFMPTLLLYLSGALLFYVPLRLVVGRTPRRRVAIAIVSAIPVALAGYAVPTLANRETQRRAEAIMVGDGGEEPLLHRTGTIALLVDRGLGGDKCSGECQRLLFSGLAATVVQGPLEALRRPAASPLPVIRHRIVPMGQGCNNDMLDATSASRAEWQGKPPPPYLWEKLDDLAQRGLCFRSDPSRDARADIYLVNTYNYDPARSSNRLYDLNLHPIEPFRRRTVLKSERERLVPLMRRTQLRYALLAVPLRLKPPFAFATYTPGGWERAVYRERGSAPHYDGMMAHWIRNDVRVTGLGKSREQEIVVVANPVRSGRKQP